MIRIGPKLEEETTHVIMRWRRVASMAYGTPVSYRLVEVVHAINHLSISRMKRAEVRQVLVARDPGPRARALQRRAVLQRIGES